MSDLFGDYNIDAMNEADVREIIVRPLLHELGYRQGTSANILTEKTLRYSKTFLGRKNPSRDPDLVGRADYICEVVSFGRWVVEVKSPQLDLTTDDAHQAHTYAAHPEIAAVFSLLTNGREFKVYRISNPDEPIFSWGASSTVENLMTIKNLLGPDAIKRRVAAEVDLAKPIALGFNSTIEIIGGVLQYDRHESDNPLLATAGAQIDGMRASVIGKTVSRLDDGRILGQLEVAGPYNVYDAINQAAGLIIYEFMTADDFVSCEIDRPTIFQNFVEARLQKGTALPALPSMLGLPIGPAGFDMPVDIAMKAVTEAVGYIEDDHFLGTFEIEYSYLFSGVNGLPQLESLLPPQANMFGEGTFDIRLRRP